MVCRLVSTYRYLIRIFLEFEVPLIVNCYNTKIKPCEEKKVTANNKQKHAL